jgi:hypothetical protein
MRYLVVLAWATIWLPAALAQVKPAPVDGAILRGTVVRVSAADHVVFIRTPAEGEMQLRLDPAATVRIDNRVVRLADLAPGTVIAAHYETRNGRPVVTAVEGPVVLKEVIKVPVAVAAGQIRGRIMEADRPQPDLEVVLRTNTGTAVANTKTAKDGTFMFEKVAPGLYVVASRKETSSSPLVGEGRVTVESGKTHEVIVSLSRAP